jgi:hypothetical protein
MKRVLKTRQMRLQLVVQQMRQNPHNVLLEQWNRHQQKIVQRMLAGNKQHFDESLV